VRVVEREKVTERVGTQLREPTVAECVERVLASPRACREVVNGLTVKAVHGRLDSGAHAATVAAIERLVQTLINSGTRPVRWLARAGPGQPPDARGDGAAAGVLKMKELHFVAVLAKAAAVCT